MTTRAPRIALAIAFLLAAPAILGQREGYSYLSWVGPEVSLVSVADDDTAARPNTPILAGDRLATGPWSRAEAILADGNILRVDVQTSVRFDRLARTYEADDDRNAISLERGAVALEHLWPTSREQATRIDTDDATVLFPDEGVLRVETGRRGTEVYVVSGRAEVYGRAGRVTLRSGQYAFASGEAPLEIDALDAPRDGFTRFVQERRDLADPGSGAEHVPAEYVYDSAAAQFDRYGTWVYVGSTGSYCWRPSVAVGWRPYVEGYWRWAPAGLTWVSYEPWGWLPYHYGSWIWDAGFGWCWVPGATYSPAWVYWSYTPSWVGWCPMGYYGGYYGSHGGYHGGPGGGHPGGGHPEPYPRSTRKRSGAERWTHAYPHLRGRVEVARIDPRGWSYTSVSRVGSRLDARRDVLSHDRVGFRPGDRGLVATAPLRIERGRGASATTAVQEAVRRVPQVSGSEARGATGLSDLTPVLRRDPTLASGTGDELRRAYVTAGRDPGYHPLPAEQLDAPRRDVAGASPAGSTARSPERGTGRPSSSTRGGEPAPPSREAGSGTRDPWREGGIATGTRTPSGTAGAPRRDGEPPLEGGFGRDRGVGADDGWRSPGADTRPVAGTSRTFDVPSRRPEPAGPEPASASGRREAAPAPEPWRSASPPSAQRAPSPEAAPRREAPAPRGDEGWRGGDTPSRSSDVPRSAPAPRTEAPPPSRSYDAPRSAPAPRTEAPPPSRSHDAPRSAPAPRIEAPPPSRSSAPAPESSSAPPRRSSPDQG